MQFLESNSNHYGNPLVTGNSPLTRRFHSKCDGNISTKFLESNSNHFGNPLVTGEYPLARKNSTKCDGDSSKYNNTDMYLQQNNRVPTSPGSPSSGAIYQDNTNIVSPTSNLTSTSSVSSAFSTTIPSESDSTRRYCLNRSFSYDSASIGLPSSYYPAGQDSSSNFEDIILEELEDFDELFGTPLLFSESSGGGKGGGAVSNLKEKETLSSTKTQGNNGVVAALGKVVQRRDSAVARCA